MIDRAEPSEAFVGDQDLPLLHEASVANPLPVDRSTSVDTASSKAAGSTSRSRAWVTDPAQRRVGVLVALRVDQAPLLGMAAIAGSRLNE